MTSKPLCKFVLGIGQLEPGKVTIVHGRAVECDHRVPMSQDCPRCLSESLARENGGWADENRLWGNLATKTRFWRECLE